MTIITKAKGEENKSDIGTKPMTAKSSEKFSSWLDIEKVDNGAAKSYSVSNIDASAVQKWLIELSLRPSWARRKGIRSRMSVQRS